MDERIAHTLSALQSVRDNWSHSHGTNLDGDIICVPCAFGLLADIHEMINKDLIARTSNGELILTDKQ